MVDAVNLNAAGTAGAGQADVDAAGEMTQAEIDNEIDMILAEAFGSLAFSIFIHNRQMQDEVANI